MIRIAFLGLGGVGGYFASKMARAYTGSAAVEIVCLAREKTAAAIRANGIKLITPQEEFVAHPHHVFTPGDAMAPVDFLICSVKSYDLENSLAQFRNCIGPHTVIIPLLNGVDAEDRVRALFPHNAVWSGCVYIVARLTAPGVITEVGAIHKLYFGSKRGDESRQQELLQLFRQAHEEVWLCREQSINNVLWEKFIFISPLASLTSYLDVCIGKILEHQSNSTLLNDLLKEICTIAHAEKIAVPADIIAVTLGKMKNLSYETTSSMHSDFQKGNRTEHHSLTAHVTHLARKHGIATPHYDRILAGLQERAALTAQ